MASKKATFSAVLPILNRGCSVPTTVPIPLSDDIALRKIRGEDLAIITEHDDEAASYLKGGRFTLTFDNFDDTIEKKDLNLKVLSALFSLNVLGTGSALALDRAYVVRSLKATSLQRTDPLPGHNHSEAGEFKIEKGVDISYAASVFAAVSAALASHPPLRITISRFNSAMGRVALDDKIIDLCIALESVFQARSEISFQFALYNAILSEGDGVKRAGIFKTLKKLYSQRSDIVHGNQDLDANWVTDNWSDLIRIAKASILRKVEFLTTNQHSQWKPYLEGAALGIANG